MFSGSRLPREREACSISVEKRVECRLSTAFCELPDYSVPQTCSAATYLILVAQFNGRTISSCLLSLGTTEKSHYISNLPREVTRCVI